MELLQPAHLRGELLHVGHRPIGRCGEGVEKQLHRKGEQDDSEPPVVDQMVEKLQELEEGDGNPPQEPVIHGEAQVRRKGF